MSLYSIAIPIVFLLNSEIHFPYVCHSEKVRRFIAACEILSVYKRKNMHSRTYHECISLEYSPSNSLCVSIKHINK